MTTKDILEKEKRSVKIGTPDDIAFVSTWNQATDHLIPIVEKLVERAKQEEWKRCVDSLDFDHSKCVLKQSCIGYGSAQSDLMNNPPK